MTAPAALQRAQDAYGHRAAILLAAILILKLLLLFWLGPSFFPDSNGYVTLGDDILAGRWLDDVGWASGPIPLPILRPYGYPLVVALAKYAAGSHFALALAALQCIASTAALGIVATALAALVARPALRYAVIVLVALSGASLYDIVLLSDSLYASLFIAVVFLIALDMTGRHHRGQGAIVALGVAWGCSIWVRDVGLYFTLFPLIGLIVADRLRGARTAAVVGSLVLFLLPVVALLALHLLWNAHRTGHFLLSLGDSINWLWPSINIVAGGYANPYDGPDFASRVVRSHPLAPGLAGMFQLIDILWREYGFDPLQIKHVTFAHFTTVLA
ncbi:MAG: hypothetical protein ACHQF3_15745, partial [Alphaproteobacteria bacterium]